ncbi:MAG TPA: hypothetical protein ENH82_07100 [bacterium]|nr:hypothetical protein [bacterium]
MKMLIPIGVFFLLQGLLFWLRRPDSGGKIGQGIRNSDWHAWNATVADKEQELANFKKVEPTR